MTDTRSPAPNARQIGPHWVKAHLRGDLFKNKHRPSEYRYNTVYGGAA
jgi:hypothetical protein